MTATQTVGGVCAGVGGLELAAGLALGPLETAWHAEYDDDAALVLATRFPGVPNHKDITTLDWRKVEPVDVYCAGFPCQPVSAAGKQAGDADARWLWPYVIDGIRTLRPPTVVVENVERLVTIQKGRLFRLILDDLRAAGYAVRWAIAGACTAGGCHHRHRVFILARYVGKTAPPALRVPMTKCVNGNPLLPTPRATDTGTPGRRASEGFRPPLSQVIFELLPTPTAADAERGPDYARMNREESGGDDLVTTIARLELLPTPRASDGTKGGPNMRGSSGDLMLPSAVQPERWGRFAAAVARSAGIFGAPPEPTQPGPRGGLRLAAPFPEWMMGYEAGWFTDLVDRKASLRLAGNGVFPQHGGRILRLLAEDEGAPTDLFGMLVAAR